MVRRLPSTLSTPCPCEPGPFFPIRHPREQASSFDDMIRSFCLLNQIHILKTWPYLWVIFVCSNDPDPHPGTTIKRMTPPTDAPPIQQIVHAGRAGLHEGSREPGDLPDLLERQQHRSRGHGAEGLPGGVDETRTDNGKVHYATCRHLDTVNTL